MLNLMQACAWRLKVICINIDYLTGLSWAEVLGTIEWNICLPLYFMALNSSVFFVVLVGCFCLFCFNLYPPLREAFFFLLLSAIAIQSLSLSRNIGTRVASWENILKGYMLRGPGKTTQRKVGLCKLSSFSASWLLRMDECCLPLPASPTYS